MLTVDGALSIPLTYFEELVMRINLRAKNPWRPFAGFKLGAPLETFLQGELSTSELAGPGCFGYYGQIN